MLNRRTLFARLSAVALAPLAKLFGGRHPSLDAGVRHVVDPPIVLSDPVRWRNFTFTYDPSGSVTITVPQEEA